MFARASAATGVDLWVVELGPGGAATPLPATPRPLVTTERAQLDPVISPDGRFVAYVSSEAGQFAVYVSRFPEGDGKWAVSSGYGSRPRWGARGDRFYFDNSGRIVEMEIDLTATFEPGPVVAQVRGGLARLGFDVAADGQRFLVPRSPGGEDQAGRLLVVQNRR